MLPLAFIKADMRTHKICTGTSFTGSGVLVCRLDDLQHQLVMSGMPLEMRTSLMNALAALPHQQEAGLPGSQPGLVPSAPRQSPLGSLSSQGR